DCLDGNMLGKVLRDRLIRTITRPPFRDELGRKGRFERIARAGPHLIRRLRLVIDGWPRWSHPDALRAHAITVLDDESRSVKVKNHSIDLVGIPNARVESVQSKQLLADLVPERPSIVLTHDPMWFANVPRGPHLTLAGHTHGGQICLPGVGILKNAS